MLLAEKQISFLKTNLSDEIISSELITNSGSNRKYFRIKTKTNSYILTESRQVSENKSFFYFSTIFAKQGILVPKIITTDHTQTLYLQEDIGNSSLLDVLLENGYTKEVYALYEKSLEQLASLQIQLKDKIDYSKCYDFQFFDEKVILNDLFYFKSYFLDRLDIDYNKSYLITEFLSITNKIALLPNDYFLYRDFQGRNIFIQNKNPYFIDFQGGMKGFPGYDLVSLLWQAKANLPENWKHALKQRYFSQFQQEQIQIHILEECYSISLLLRILQLLGAYGLRGLVEKKQHFVESIYYNIQNVKRLLNEDYIAHFPYLKNILEQIITNKTEEKINKLIYGT